MLLADLGALSSDLGGSGLLDPFASRRGFSMGEVGSYYAVARSCCLPERCRGRVRGERV